MNETKYEPCPGYAVDEPYREAHEMTDTDVVHELATILLGHMARQEDPAYERELSMALVDAAVRATRPNLARLHGLLVTPDGDMLRDGLFDDCKYNVRTASLVYELRCRSAGMD